LVHADPADADRVQAGQQQLASVDFVPFQTMIQERNPENYFVMVSHLTYDALDSSSPASLSPKIITGILREQMGFKGLIITDDTEMGALSKHYDFSEIGVRAVQAGVDIVMVCHEYEHETAVYNGLLKALQSGELSTERVDASVKRIVRAKLLHLMK
jgi:beta-N-acetylhexosaminidase